jgi:hypothetical protein
MTAITRPYAWTSGAKHTGTRDSQDHSAILLAQDPPCAVATRSTNQSINNNAATDVSFTTEHVDNDTLFAATSTTITIVHDGYYMILAGVAWATTSSAGARAASIAINGTNQDDMTSEMTALTASPLPFPRHTVGGVISLVTSDTVKLNVYQNSGGALNLTKARLAVVRISGPGS